jgi:hypothetical protein
LSTDIITARDHTTPIADANGLPKLIKWEKANKYNLAAYKRVVEAYFTFPARHRLSTLKNLETHCIVVDTSSKTLKSTGEGDVEIGFNKEVYFLCVPIMGKRLPNALFHLYPDRRTTKHSLAEARNIMNAGARKYGDKREWPYRELKFEDPEKKQALQLFDILIGAIAYRLNGHYAKPDANSAKRELCDHIFRWARIKTPLVNTDYFRKRLTIVHRPPRWSK